MAFIKRPVHNFICENCKKESFGFNNQRFCNICSIPHEKEHKKIHDREYYQKNEEKIKKYNRKYWKDNYIPHPKKLLTDKEKKYRIIEYNKKNKKRISVVRKKYKILNREKILKKSKIYYLDNIKRIEEYRESYKPRRKIINRIYFKIKNSTDIQFKLRNRLRNRLYMSLRTYTKKGKIMKSNDYNINYKKIIEHLKPFPKDISNYHVDHIIPLHSFDLTDLEEVRNAFAPENHQWLTIHENHVKGGKII